uniref:Uncharacterized protein n=1 Tax=Tanacetum cinerariifolium TaxID=118510 RepID=A0A6L2KTJ4_TANCI|nr:hypothetical protein [Tanacetum cinerariifolium]
MIEYVSIVETDMVIHTAKTEMMKHVVEIKCVGMNADEFDKETGSSDMLQPKQADLSCVHALNEPHLHEILVVPKEIDLTFTSDDPMPPSIEEDDDDSRDILIREELLDNYSLPLPENESFHFDIPLSSRPPAKPPDGNTEILNIKMIGDVSDQKVPIPEFMITHVSN